MTQQLTEHYLFSCVLIVSAIGLVASTYTFIYLLLKTIDIVLAAFQMKPLITEFAHWYRQKRRDEAVQKVRAMLLNRTQDSDKPAQEDKRDRSEFN